MNDPTASGEPARSPEEVPEIETRIEQHQAADGEAQTARRPRRIWLPVMLFALTCVSTFLAGAAGWVPFEYLARGDGMGMRVAILAHWQDGLIYMFCLLAILLTHEMGHFLATLWHRIHASLPYFLPFPISPIGTMGAVIGMDGTKANRKETFDIGLAGPLAGLAVIIPVLWVGIEQMDWTAPRHGPFTLDAPLLVRWVLEYLRPEGYQSGSDVWYSQLNPWFMAGWVGLLITGLNMLPVSQLDGGHVIYTLFGRRSYWIARGFMLLAVGYILYAQAMNWSLMVVLVLLMGTDHPPTRDDTVPLGWMRIIVGLASLLIPLLCFPLHVLKPVP